MRGRAPSAEADVVVVGAGLAGLRTAELLAGAGRSVCVCEARERVGGRLLNATIGQGVQAELGGQWMGAGHRRLEALAETLGVEVFPSYAEGQNLLELGGRQRRYSGTIPRLNPLTLLELLRARRRVDRLARRVDPGAPWEARGAAGLDSQSFATWLRRNVHSPAGRTLLATAGRTVWGASPAELSMLHVLFYVSAAGGIDRLFDTEGGAQQDRFAGGAQLLALRLAERLGDSLHLGAPVRRIEQDSEGVRVLADGIEASARRAVLAIPPVLASQIEQDPPLPGLRRQLGHRMFPGTLIKCQALYEKPFWRQGGLSGEAVSDAGYARLTFDSSPMGGSPGLLLAFVGGPEARELLRAPADQRRAAVLGDLARMFGPHAGRPLDFVQQSWADEQWSAGGPTSSFGPGGWTAYGPELRRPVGHVHWAGTETATAWSGYMEGALESAERAAAEVLSSLGEHGAPHHESRPRLAEALPA